MTASNHGRTCDRLLSSFEPIIDCLLRQTSFGTVLRHKLWLRSNEFGDLPLHGGHNPRVDLLPATSQNGAVSSILHQGVLESVFGVRRSSSAEDQLGGHKLLQRFVQLVLRHLSDSTDHLERERTAKRRSDLRHLPRRREPVKPGQ